MEHEEADLILRCQNGDQAARKEIFDRYRERVYRVAYGVVRHREEALDIVQEVFIKLFRSIKNFKGRSHFYTYLYRMVMNTAIDHKRKVGKQFMSSLDEEGSFEPSDEAASPRAAHAGPGGDDPSPTDRMPGFPGGGPIGAAAWGI